MKEQGDQCEESSTDTCTYEAGDSPSSFNDSELMRVMLEIHLFYKMFARSRMTLCVYV